jgi:hypothetical protein
MSVSIADATRDHGDVLIAVTIAELFFATWVQLYDDADLALSTSRARCARRPDFRRRPSHGLPSDRVVPTGESGARLECESGGAAHACVGQAPPTRRWCGGRPSSSDVRADHDKPTRDGWTGALLDGVARLGYGSHPNAPPAPNAGGASCIGASRTAGRNRSWRHATQARRRRGV